MKACRNCRVVYTDEYNGQCHECGAPMGGVEANGSNDLSFRFAAQVAAGKREGDAEGALKRGRYDGISIHDRVMDVAREFVVQTKELPPDV